MQLNSNTPSQQNCQHRTGDPTGWGVVSASVMQNAKISLELRAVLSIVATLPPTWNFHLGWLRAKTGLGRNKMQGVMAEAREWGFVEWHIESRGDRSIRSYYEWRNAREWEEIVKTGKKPRNSRLPGFSPDERKGSLSKSSTGQLEAVNPFLEGDSFSDADEIDDSQLKDTSSGLGVGVDLDSRLREEKYIGFFANNAKNSATIPASRAKQNQPQNQNLPEDEQDHQPAPAVIPPKDWAFIVAYCDELCQPIDGPRNRGRLRALWEATQSRERFQLYLDNAVSFATSEDVWPIAIHNARSGCLG